MKWNSLFHGIIISTYVCRKTIEKKQNTVLYTPQHNKRTGFVRSPPSVWNNLNEPNYRHSCTLASHMKFLCKIHNELCRSRWKLPRDAVSNVHGLGVIRNGCITNEKSQVYIHKHRIVIFFLGQTYLHKLQQYAQRNDANVMELTDLRLIYLGCRNGRGSSMVAERTDRAFN